LCYYLDPCLNKNCGAGVCTRKSNATYEAICSCPVNRLGDSCELSRGRLINTLERLYSNELFILDLCRVAPRCGGGYCKPNYASARGYSCVCEGGVIKPDPCPFSKSNFFSILSSCHLIVRFLFSMSNQRLWK